MSAPMKVRDLIEALKKVDPDRDVLDAMIVARVHKFLSSPLRTKRWDARVEHDILDCFTIEVGGTKPVP